MKFKSLLQTDMSELKSVKLDDVRSQFRNPMVVIKFLAIVVAFGVLVFGWSTGNKRKQVLIGELEQQQAKLKVYQELKSVKSDYEVFSKNLAKSVNGDVLIKEISELAEQKRVKIISFAPSDRKLNDLVNASTLSLNVNAETYEDFVAFIESIEKSPYLMRMERWSGNMREISSQGPNGKPQKVIDGRMEVSGLAVRDSAPIQ